MLAVSSPTDKGVELRTSVPTIHIDGLPVAFPQGVENLLHKGAKVLFRLKVRTVPEALPDGGVAFQHFADGEVLHGSIMVNG